jgi:class 3 adenylate cyclase
MSDLLSTMASYVPPSVVRRVLAETQCPREPYAERFPAATLFADVSGFTPLTAALGRKGAEGPEELTRLLNTYFGHVITLIEAEGGEVVKFGGDAVTVLFPAEGEPLSYAVRRALQAAEAMQAAMAEFAALPTSVGPISLGMKVGIGAGEVLAMQVGGYDENWEFVIAGDPLHQVAAAEKQAERGKIVLSPEAAAALCPEPLPARPLGRPAWAAIADPTAVARVLRCFVLKPVLAWLDQGLYEWLAVLRPMSVMFVGVYGMDYGRPDVLEPFHNFVRMVQETIADYGGVLSRLSVGDKGTVLLILFGAPPFSHEDDPLRAVRAALDLQDQAGDHAVQLAIGITTGHLFAGPVGGETRREYTVMGDAANMAARLMGKAGAGGILCDSDTYQQAQGQVSFEGLLPMRIKGKVGPMWVYRPLEVLASETKVVSHVHGRLVGREGELAGLEAILATVEAGETRVLIVQGEAGIGKSRLAVELAQMAAARRLTVLRGGGRSTEQQAPYRAWREVLRDLFDLQGKLTPEERRQRVRFQVQERAPDQMRRLPLLNDVLSLGFEDNEYVAGLSPAQRKQSLIALLLRLLRGWAQERPLLLLLEDAQWMDSLSWDLAVYLARSLSVAEAPLLLVLVMRPFDDYNVGAQYLATLHLLVDVDELWLEGLGAEETVRVAEERLGLPEGGLPEVVAALVRQRAGGNPFYAEELVLNLREHGVIRVELDPRRRGERGGRPYRCQVIKDLDAPGKALPDTLQGLVLDRIDRLPAERQMVLKVGAVIGDVFDYRTLRDVLEGRLGVDERGLRGHLDALTILGVEKQQGSESELQYVFHNVLAREAAYETLLYAQRRELHRAVARWYVQNYGGEEEVTSLQPYLPLLVHHYHQAGEKEHECFYARLAGEQAARQYANVEAITYLTRALDLTPEEDIVGRRALLQLRKAAYTAQGDVEASVLDEAMLAQL